MYTEVHYLSMDMGDVVVGWLLLRSGSGLLHNSLPTRRASCESPWVGSPLPRNTQHTRAVFLATWRRSGSNDAGGGGVGGAV